MSLRRALRALPIFVLTVFIVVLVDLQLRTRSLQKPAVRILTNVEHQLSKRIPTRQTESASLPSGSLATLSSVIEKSKSQIPGEKRERVNKARINKSRETNQLHLTDIFIAVKTTGRFHRSRLALLLETWISRTKQHDGVLLLYANKRKLQSETDFRNNDKTEAYLKGGSLQQKKLEQSTYIFTDTEDEDISSKGYNIIVTDCSPEHSHQALSCKMAAEYDHFMASDKKWLCHVDDDNYLNPAALLSLLSAFPLDNDIYVGKPSLDRPMRAHELLEGNQTREMEFWFATGGAGFCLSRRLAEKMAPWASGPRFEQTSAVIRLPDDCTVGFIVERRLGVAMVHSPMFHSHLENLLLLTPSNIPLQVTLSYGMFEGKMNSVELKGVFSKDEDPSRFKTVHCLLYPVTSWCP